MFQVDHVGEIVGDEMLEMKYSDAYEVKDADVLSSVRLMEMNLHEELSAKNETKSGLGLISQPDKLLICLGLDRRHYHQLNSCSRPSHLEPHNFLIRMYFPSLNGLQGHISLRCIFL